MYSDSLSNSITNSFIILSLSRGLGDSRLLLGVPSNEVGIKKDSIIYSGRTRFLSASLISIEVCNHKGRKISIAKPNDVL